MILNQYRSECRNVISRHEKRLSTRELGEIIIEDIDMELLDLSVLGKDEPDWVCDQPS